MNKSYWIWHYGDYEIYHTMNVNLQREERGYGRPAFWKLHTPYVNVKFTKKFVSKGGYLKAYFNGSGYIAVNGARYNEKVTVKIPEGECQIVALVSNFGGFPALFVESDVCPSDESWSAYPFYNETTLVGWNKKFDSPDMDPQVFPFEYEKKFPIEKRELSDGVIFDFGTELFGFLNISNANKNEKIEVFYGESEEEALDTAHTHTTDEVEGKECYHLKQRALRYVFLKSDNKDLQVDVDFEFLPLEKLGSFECNKPIFNEIYDVAAYTFHLNCREGFLDGLKRDRWIWAGDSYQAARINTYLFRDKEIEERTIVGLIGRPPVLQHPNKILDYSLLWLIGLYENYMVYGDENFLRRIYPVALDLLKFCEGRINSDGFIEGKDEDWTFIDWAYIDKTGAVCAEQMLLIASYNAFAKISDAIGEDGREYYKKAENLKNLVNEYYWNEERGAFIDSYKSNLNVVTRHSNIFALMYDIATDDQKKKIIEHVLLNDKINSIRTPYFKGYELDVMAKMGFFEYIEKELESYWGEMIARGAKTIWEYFDVRQTGIERYAMCDDKYDKSLCHAWGAGPIYIFGRYYLGVYPTTAGFKTFNVEPNLGNLESFKGKVPINDGVVEVSLDKTTLKVKATRNGGTLIFNNERITLEANNEIIIER